MKMQAKEFKGNGFNMVIKERAHELGFTLKDVASLLNVCTATLDNWSNFRVPTVFPEKKMKELAELLDLDPKFLSDRYNEARVKSGMDKAHFSFKSVEEEPVVEHIDRIILDSSELPKSTIPDVKKNAFSSKVLLAMDNKGLTMTSLCVSLMTNQRELVSWLNLETIPPTWRVEKLARILGISQEKLVTLIETAKKDPADLIIEDILKCDEYLRKNTKEGEQLIGNGLTLGDYTYRYEGLCYAILKQDDKKYLKVMPVIVIPNKDAMKAILSAEEWTEC